MEDIIKKLYIFYISSPQKLTSYLLNNNNYRQFSDSGGDNPFLIKDSENKVESETENQIKNKNGYKLKKKGKLNSENSLENKKKSNLIY